MKRPKFIIGDNPMGEPGEGTYIVHLEDPIFYVEIFEHRDKQEQSDFHDYLIRFQEENRISVAVGRDKDFKQPFSLVFIGQVPDNQEFVDKMTTIIREMADWYKEFILWEESNG